MEVDFQPGEKGKGESSKEREIKSALQCKGKVSTDEAAGPSPTSAVWTLARRAR